MQGWAGSGPSCGNYSASLRQLQRDHAYFHTAVSVTNDQKNTQLFGTCGNVPQLHPLHQHVNALPTYGLCEDWVLVHGFDSCLLPRPSPYSAVSVAPAPALSKLPTTQWSMPSYTLPTPSLQSLFHLERDMGSFQHTGPEPHGDRSTVICKRGSFEVPKLRGEILLRGVGAVHELRSGRVLV